MGTLDLVSSGDREIGRREVAAGGLAVLLAVVALLAWAGPAPAAPKSFATGVSGVYSADPLAVGRVKGSGASFIQVAVTWGAVAPAREPKQWRPEDPDDPAYDWERADQEVKAAVEAGLTPVLLIDSAPLWAQRCKAAVTEGTGLCDPDPDALAAFATAAARRYSGELRDLPRVTHWQGLNEPNLSLFFNPQFRDGRPVSPMLYRRLINAFHDAVKSVHASNVVIAAGLGPIAVPHHTIGPMRFARILLCMNRQNRPVRRGGQCRGGVRFDVFDIHPYTTGGPTHRGRVDDVQIGDLGKLRDLIRAADRAGRIKSMFRRTPIWITEFSWDSDPPDPGGVPMRLAARWSARAMHNAWLAGIDHFFWFSLRDSSSAPAFNLTVQSGLYERGDTLEQDRPKLILRAFRFPFVALRARRGIRYWGRTPESEPGRVLIQSRREGGWRTLVRTRANSHGVFEGFVRTRFGADGRGQVRARFRSGPSLPFGMREVKDYYQPPFG